MLQDMDNMEGSCVFYVKITTFDQLEQSRVCVLMMTKIGIVKLIVQHDIHSWPQFHDRSLGFLRQTSSDVFSLEE